MSTDPVSTEGQDEAPQGNSQQREKEFRDLREELRVCKCRRSFDWTCLGVGVGVILITVCGFWSLACEIVAKQLSWLQLTGLLALSVLWLCVVALVVPSLGVQKRR